MKTFKTVILALLVLIVVDAKEIADGTWTFKGIYVEDQPYTTGMTSANGTNPSKYLMMKTKKNTRILLQETILEVNHGTETPSSVYKMIINLQATQFLQ